MALLQKDHLDGANDWYRMNPSAKKYALRDNGFEETKNGNFQFSRDLEIGKPTSPKLKITISSDLKSLKMSAVTANGLRSVNLYKNDKTAEAREKAEYLLSDFVESNIVEKAND
ncbi:hypothetical protein [Pisciglobus halotolerans]|uniref:Putative amino acid metabolism n=1 Tax=Pisciglobus halotolerans TaxID=745365 RepID=A0A1I3DEW8_9LACT|nr:hypothetical protein [Pisciglobus halotolerans]SFH85021.1 Putative amino acid metabolism [Pisciglobus halotolerans]